MSKNIAKISGGYFFDSHCIWWSYGVSKKLCHFWATR